MNARVKMECKSVEPLKDGFVKVSMETVSDDENRAFNDGITSGSFEITIQGDKPAATMFAVGDYFYAEFSPRTK